MKLISLNLWSGREYGALAAFLKEKSEMIDVFCFQEVMNSPTKDKKSEVEINKKKYSGSENEEVSDLYPRLKRILTNFDSVATEPYSSLGEHMAIFFKKRTKVRDYGEFVAVDPLDWPMPEGGTFKVSCKIQYIEVSSGSDTYLISNTHGLWQSGGKKDTKERLNQSDRMVEFLNRYHEKKILIGDFNLEPDTESIRKIENAGMSNLIRLHRVKSTRSKLTPKSKGQFADYAFVSKSVQVMDFKVMQDIVSDHLPLYLDFS